MSDIWQPIWQNVWDDGTGFTPVPATHEVFQVSDSGGVPFEVDDGASGHENFEVKK